MTRSTLHPLAMDDHAAFLVAAGKHFVNNQRFFRQSGAQSIYKYPELLNRWQATIGVSKSFTKWVLSIVTNTSGRNTATAVFGKDLSPIKPLGTRSVSSYIRHLLFGEGWTPEQVSIHLIEQHSYTYSCAKPMISRIIRQENDPGTKGKQSNYYSTHNERSLFPERVVVVTKDDKWTPQQ